MGRKSKKLLGKRIPLSALDKVIYTALILISCVLPLVLTFLFIGVAPRHIRNAEISVVAYDTGFAPLSIMFLSLVLFFFGAVVFGNAMKNKQPIFGNPKYKPKWSDHIVKTYPLFSQEFKQNLSVESKKKAIKVAVAFAVLMAVSLVGVFLAIYPRETLDRENNIIKYNSFNEITDEKNIAEADSLLIRVTFSNSRRSAASFHIQLDFIFDDQTYSFAESAFYDMNMEETLHYMLSLKSLFEDGRYKLEGVDMLESMVVYESFSAREETLLYKLFDYPQK